MIDMKNKQSKITVSAILAVTILVAGIFAFSPIDEASTVHDTIVSDLQGAGGLDLDDLVANSMKLAVNADVEVLTQGVALGTGDVTISVDGDGCLAVTAIIIALTGAAPTQDLDNGESMNMMDPDITIAGVVHTVEEGEEVPFFVDGGVEMISLQLMNLWEEGDVALSQDEIAANLNDNFGEHIRNILTWRYNAAHWNHIHVDMWPKGWLTPPCAGGQLRIKYKDGTVTIGEPFPLTIEEEEMISEEQIAQDIEDLKQIVNVMLK